MYALAKIRYISVYFFNIL